MTVPLSLPRFEHAVSDPQPTIYRPIVTSATGPPNGDSPSQRGDGFDLTLPIETAYVWDLVSDDMTWEAGATSLFDLTVSSAISTGASYNLLIAPEHVGRRTAAIGRGVTDGDRGVPYRVQYRVLPGGHRTQTSLFLEDNGRWWADAQGRPARARGVVRVISESVREQQRLLIGNDHDDLTGQLTRGRLTDALTTVLQRSVGGDHSAGLLMVSVNNLAIINETFGFDIGDEVISAAGRLIQARLRGGDTIGRYSSNKFGIIVNNCDSASLRTAAHRFACAVRDSTISTSVCQLSATVSIGGVLLPDQANSLNRAINNSMQALDHARQLRPDCYYAYEPSAVRETLRRRNILVADEVITALDQNRLELALQPIVCARTRQVVLREALLRLRRKDGSIVSAGDFMEIAEQLGLSRLIDRRTLELGMAVLNRQSATRLSINVSSRTAHDLDWLADLRRLSHNDRPTLERLTVEITETTAIEDLDQTVMFVDTLKDLGCRVAIDDFGAGYTSFKNLKHLNVDMVKIDGSFVQNMKLDRSDRVFVKTLAELARSFEIETVAEWVGDEETAQICRDSGISLLQGFYTGRPQLLSELRNENDAPASTSAVA